MNIIAKLAALDNEPIISDENEKTLQDITSITKVSQFTEMNLSEEKCDELLVCLREQENFGKEIIKISRGLERVSSIILKEEVEEDYI